MRAFLSTRHLGDQIHRSMLVLIAVLVSQIIILFSFQFSAGLFLWKSQSFFIHINQSDDSIGSIEGLPGR